MFQVIYKDGKVQYVGETISADDKHTVLIRLFSGDYKEVKLSEVIIDLTDEQRDITDNRVFCYICSKIVRKGTGIKLPAPEGTEPLSRHENCQPGSRKWMGSEVGKNSPMRDVFKIEGEDTPRRHTRKREQKPQTPCRCGCGTPGGGNFRPGHDAKLKSKMIINIKAGKSWDDGLDPTSIEYANLNWVNLLSDMLTKHSK